MDVNSEKYWDTRFNEDWISNQGQEQSVFFAKIGLTALPEWLKVQIHNNKLSICDWGCALGNGTNLISSQFAASSTTGIDFSSVAIDKARKLYPHINFLHENIVNVLHDSKYDVIFSSNTLEHFSNPWDVLLKLSNYANLHIIVLVPYKEYERYHEHLYTFDENNIPSDLGSLFSLSHMQIINARNIPSTCWSGFQVLLVYSNNSVISETKLKVLTEKDKKLIEVVNGQAEILNAISELKRNLTEGPSTLTPNHMTTEQIEKIVATKIEEIGSNLVEKQVELKNSADLIETYQKKILTLENQVFALSHQISSKIDMENSSFKKAVISFFESGISSPMFKTYVEYALTSIDRGKNIVEKYRHLMPAKFEYLDIGCAYGGSVISMIKSGAKRAVGVDVDERLLELAKLQAADLGVNDKTTFVYTDIQNPDTVTSLGTFDLITCIDVLEHVIEPELSLTSLSKLGKKNSVLIVDIPNPYSPYWIIKDPHHHLFGTVLLEREDAVKQFFHHYPNSQEYLVGFFNDFDWYKKVFHNLGFSIHILNESVGSNEEWENLKSEINNLSNYAQQLSVTEDWPDWLQEKIFSRLQWYVEELNKDEIKYNDDTKYLCNKYGISVYHLKCIKNK